MRGLLPPLAAASETARTSDWMGREPARNGCRATTSCKRLKVRSDGEGASNAIHRPPAPKLASRAARDASPPRPTRQTHSASARSPVQSGTAKAGWLSRGPFADSVGRSARGRVLADVHFRPNPEMTFRPESAARRARLFHPSEGGFLATRCACPSVHLPRPTSRAFSGRSQYPRPSSSCRRSGSRRGRKASSR